MFLKIGHQCAARSLQGRPKCKHERAKQTKSECRRQNCGVGYARPYNVERHQLAHRSNQQVRRPESKNESAHAAEQRQHKAFGQKLANDAPTITTERETNCYFFAPRSTAR